MVASKVSGAVLGKLARRLKFPQLFFLTAGLFVLDLFVPDMIPLIDEILLGLATLLFGTWKERDAEADKPEMKDVTPPQG